MNGSTNVQISAIATFVSVLVLWLAGFFLPDLMATAPEMLGELFTGALIVIAGLAFAPDAGIKQLPGTGTNTSCPPLVGLLALLLAVLTISGCAGTRAAYKAAEGLSETAYVVGEHYYAEVREVNDLADAGRLSAAELQNLQNIAQATRPTVVAMLNAASAYKLVQSTANEAELSAALAEAAVSISKLVDAIKAVGGSTHLTTCTSAARRTGSVKAMNYCTLVAAR